MKGCLTIILAMAALFLVLCFLMLIGEQGALGFFMLFAIGGVFYGIYWLTEKHGGSPKQ